MQSVPDQGGLLLGRDSCQINVASLAVEQLDVDRVVHVHGGVDSLATVVKAAGL